MTRPHVTVRMYQGLLGDCFLLRFFKGGKEPDRSRPADENILIDCGILQGSPQAAERMERVARNIKKDAGRLDLVVVTHEHYDHLSGFGIASDIFFGKDGIPIDNLWLAWTENPLDKDAIRLRALAGDVRMAIGVGIERIEMHARETNGQEERPSGEAQKLAGFLGPLGVDGQGRWTSRRVLDELKARAGTDAYLEPGEVRDTPGAIGLRTFVLGPPRDPKRLFKDMPSKVDRETYLAARESEAAATVRNFANCDGACGLDGLPFSKRYQQIKEAELLDPLLKEPPLECSPAHRKLWDIRQKYLASESGDQAGRNWRQVDTDWYGALDALAIKLDSDTNNSSLVLAFETEAGGDVMLFAADAQVGNWLSWHDQKYPKDADAGDQVDAPDLLRRTSLYKVGHHGSPNATLRAAGLEQMTHRRLTAMLPVVEEVAQKRGWHFPSEVLNNRLLERTEGRMLRGDQPPDPEVRRRDPAFDKAVREAPRDSSELGPLWVEYDVC